jgi:hypothetical protein
MLQLNILQHLAELAQQSRSIKRTRTDRHFFLFFQHQPNTRLGNMLPPHSASQGGRLKTSEEICGFHRRSSVASAADCRGVAAPGPRRWT